MCKDEYDACVSKKCSAGYYLSGGKCYTCSNQCSECTDEPDNCMSCAEENHIPSGEGGCECSGNYFTNTQGECVIRPLSVKMTALSNFKEIELEFSR